MVIKQNIEAREFEQLFKERFIPYYEWHYIVKPFLIKRALIYGSILISGVALIKLVSYFLVA